MPDDDRDDASMEDGQGGQGGRDQDLAWFDPNQSKEERREITRGMRDLISKTKERQDDLLGADSKLFTKLLGQSDNLIHKTKQTSEATIDSRFVLGMAELAYRRAARVTDGSAADGVDVDEFVSKCITYMRHGQGIADDAHVELSSTQRQRRSAGVAAGPSASRRNCRSAAAAGSGDNSDSDNDEVGDAGDMLNWAHFGKYACVPFVRRPALPGLLLGPLSVQKKLRKVGKRTAPLRINSLEEVRPEVLSSEEIAGGAGKHARRDLAHMCTQINKLLETAEGQAQSEMEAEFEKLPPDQQEDPAVLRSLYAKYALLDTGGMDFIRFAVNPWSFGQTIENIFYISFLIRDGNVMLDFDENGMPSISSQDTTDPEAVTLRNSERHQAVVTLDETIWKGIIEAFNITEPMIPHRAEESTQGPGARGWYS